MSVPERSTAMSVRLGPARVKQRRLDLSRAVWEDQMRFHRNAELGLAGRRELVLAIAADRVRENPDRRERRSRETVGFDARH
ncbi:MAG: hypothetical protein A2Y55_10895 [Actinobacteria bacterium RBG_16_68_12]|nr:MAG: hypothetical protein A2Y55_10895 [Actinobacteria bacterium RBG_16_68_12]